MMEYLLDFVRNKNPSSNQNEFGWNVLHTTILQGKHISLSTCIAMHPTLINEGNIYGVTALHLAVRWNRIESLKILLQQSNINVNIVDEDGWTPLHDAARLGRPKCMKMLLSHPDIANNVLDNYGWTPIYCTASAGHTECFKLLLQKGHTTADGVNYWTHNLIHNLVRYGRNECLRILLNKNVNFNISNARGSTPLHYAAMYGRHSCFELLITDVRVNVNTVNNYGYTALHYAIEKRDLMCAMKLLDFPNIDVNIRNKAGYTPIHYAIEYNECEIINKLIDKTQAKTDIPDKNGWTCEHRAAADGKTDILQILYDRNLINIYAKTNDGDTVLEFAFRQKATLKFLLKIDDKYGCDLIKHAAIQQHEKLFQLLLNRSANLRHKYSNIFPPNEFNSRYTIKGRQSELRNIYDILGKHKKMVVYGPGGIGKTALVKSYSWSYPKKYSKSIWINCESEDSIKHSFYELATYLRISTKKYEVDRELILIVRDIFTKLKMKPSLIIFDNVISINVIETYVHYYPKIHFIFITRQNIFSETEIKCIQLEPVTEAAAVEFFDVLFHDKILPENNRESISRLTRTLKYVPIALVAAKFHIICECASLYKIFDLNRYINDLELQQRIPPHLPRTTHIIEFNSNEFNQVIYSTFIVSLYELHTYELLAAAIFLDPIYLDVRTLMHLVNIIYDNKLLTSTDPPKFNISLDLAQYSFIDIVNNEIFINSYIRHLTLYHPLCKHIYDSHKHTILKLLLSGDYSQHYEHIFKLSFRDSFSFTEVLLEFEFLKLLKPLVRYSYTNSLSYLFSDMDLNDIQKYVKKYKLLHEAVKSGDIKTVAFIYKYEKNIKGSDEMGHTMIWNAIHKNYSDILIFLIEKGATYQQIDKLNKTPLHRAAFLGKTEIVKFLLDKGVNPNITNKFQRTPLHYAAMEGHNDVIEELLKHKDININARDHYRRSPVFETVRCYQIESLKLFIRKGAKINTKDNLDLSPIRLAKLQKNKIEILKVFKDNNVDTEEVINNSCNLL